MSSVPRTSAGPEGRPLALIDVAPALGKAQADLQAAAFPGKIDLVTRELVRILSGRLAKCTMCRNLRLQAAIDRGFEESMVAALDDVEHSDLDDRKKAALRLADAFLNDPTGFGPADREQLLAHFSSEEVAELVLDLVRLRPGSKLAVATGTEPDHDELIVW
jgi:alkylhydroperoxidase family enzyme